MPAAKNMLRGQKRPLSSEMGLSSMTKAKRNKHVQGVISLRKAVTPASAMVEGGGATNIHLPKSRLDLIFKAVPLELHQKIAEYLPTDQDVSRYSRVCKKTRESISSSVWRKRFVNTFDMSGTASTEELMKTYIFRRWCTKDWVIFDKTTWRRHFNDSDFSRIEQERNAANQSAVLAVLRDLILESDAYKGYDEDGNVAIIGLNQDYIRGFIAWPGHPQDAGGHTDLMAAVHNIGDLVTKKSNTRRASSATTDILPLAKVIQLCLNYWYLHPSTCTADVSHFDDSQRQAYLCQKVEPIFRGPLKQELNIDWVLHMLNFWKLQLKVRAEGLFEGVYGELDPQQQIQPWLGKIKEGTQQLGAHWRGLSTYLDRSDMMKIRNEFAGPFLDEAHIINGRDNPFQDFTLFFNDETFPAKYWPPGFEKMLRGNPFEQSAETANPLPRRSRRGKQEYEQKTPEIKQFYGSSMNGKDVHLCGRVHALPAHEGVYGFQRVTMLKFYPDTNGSYDYNQVWAYEGCVLPGGRVIIGRWWAPREELLHPEMGSYSGPFIFWNVDNSDTPNSITGDEALDFLASINDTYILVG